MTTGITVSERSNNDDDDTHSGVCVCFVACASSPTSPSMASKDNAPRAADGTAAVAAAASVSENDSSVAAQYCSADNAAADFNSDKTRAFNALFRDVNDNNDDDDDDDDDDDVNGVDDNDEKSTLMEMRRPGTRSSAGGEMSEKQKMRDGNRRGAGNDEDDDDDADVDDDDDDGGGGGGGVDAAAVSVAVADAAVVAVAATTGAKVVVDDDVANKDDVDADVVDNDDCMRRRLRCSTYVIKQTRPNAAHRDAMTNEIATSSSLTHSPLCRGPATTAYTSPPPPTTSIIPPSMLRSPSSRLTLPLLFAAAPQAGESDCLDNDIDEDDCNANIEEDDVRCTCSGRTPSSASKTRNSVGSQDDDVNDDDDDDDDDDATAATRGSKQTYATQICKHAYTRSRRSQASAVGDNNADECIGKLDDDDNVNNDDDDGDDDADDDDNDDDDDDDDDDDADNDADNDAQACWLQRATVVTKA
jgi:hypothetical protein